ncbi:GrpB family protein [Arsukibacterium sp.]|uniref:GrpB family protein n=1 Tax=Arsukibacterium sp. TaxID=1977258 RepID=UPI002FDB939B
MATPSSQDAIAEPVWLQEWQSEWPVLAETEAAFLRQQWPAFFNRRIAHFGSTAIPGMPAKPIIDLLVEVNDLTEIRDQAAPLMAKQGYQLFWQPKIKGEQDIGYLWFIKRNEQGQRSHHLHMLTPDSAHWRKLDFCHYMQQHPVEAARYAALKRQAATEFPHDRLAYNNVKADFIAAVMQQLGNNNAE